MALWRPQDEDGRLTEVPPGRSPRHDRTAVPQTGSSGPRTGRSHHRPLGCRHPGHGPDTSSPPPTTPSSATPRSPSAIPPAASSPTPTPSTCPKKRGQHLPPSTAPTAAAVPLSRRADGERGHDLQPAPRPGAGVRASVRAGAAVWARYVRGTCAVCTRWPIRVRCRASRRRRCGLDRAEVCVASTATLPQRTELVGHLLATNSRRPTQTSTDEYDAYLHSRRLTVVRALLARPESNRLVSGSYGGRLWTTSMRASPRTPSTAPTPRRFPPPGSARRPSPGSRRRRCPTRPSGPGSTRS